MKAILIRLQDDGKQTLGELRIYDGVKLLFTCKTLELPYLNNERGVSCIPAGHYLVKKRNELSSRFQYEHFHIQDVPNRDYILIHRGNYNHQIQGCILVGMSFTDINKDGLLDVTNSKVTLYRLLESTTDTFLLQII